jgi:signal transduction histidine kinase
MSEIENLQKQNNKLSPRSSPIRSKSKLGELTRDLHERVKELNCLYEISSLVENVNLSIDEFLQYVTDVVPRAWQYPEITCSRIKLSNRSFTSPKFKKTRFRQAQDIIVDGQKFGNIEVYYLKETPIFDEGPFLKEERSLLNVIAERIGHNIEHKFAANNVKLLYERERELREKLQTEIRLRVDFTRKLIHELKTPLTSLIATSNLLYDETKGEKIGKLAQYVQDSANNLNSRIEELHDVIKGEIGTLKLNLKKVNIRDLLYLVVEENRALCKECGISISLRLDESLPEIYADSDRVRQVILNLINNVCHHAKSGKKIFMRAILKSSVVQIEVQDFGPGIPIERQGKLFAPGYQMAYPNDLSGGLGIGLVLCRTLVELHGGRIWLKSKPGKGAKFCFTLPIKVEENKNYDESINNRR